ncbi:MAG TPA: hypothetical protein VMG36_04965 [Thermoplasmata archaeon]|nr:hypothetical protein [Thermoplasmata archaeon]
MSAAATSPVTQPLNLPPPDSPGGAAFAIAFAAGLVYLIVFIAAYPGMASLGLWLTTTALVGGVIATFALGGMLGTDIATYQRLELDVARTVLAHLNANDAPGPEAPLGGVWRAYVTVADESRRVARVHAYAFGPFLWGTVISLGAALIAGLGAVTRTANTTGFGVLVGLIGFSLLILGAATLLLTVGYADEVAGYRRFAARRWRRNSTRLPAVEEALSGVPWLPEFHRGVRESRTDPETSTLRWISQ